MQQSLLDFQPNRKVYSVSELNNRIRGLLDREFGDLSVSGEISGVRLAASGHFYFTLKDGDSQIKCACFRTAARYLRFKPADGVMVIARGRLDIYDARGEYQLLVEHLEPQGYGALQLAFEQLKKKLDAEGLFDTARKRPLPKYPQRIGIVTSPDGAVIQDILNVLTRRFPGLHIRLYPAQVQGDGAVDTVCRGLRYFSQSEWAEVVILARGGGSLEDLWTFNEEDVARAIATSHVPVVSAIGHETDFTIADFVADLRAPTPSAAAELVVCNRDQLLELLDGYRRTLIQQLRYRLSIAARRLHERGVDRAQMILHRTVGRNFQRTDELERSSTDALRRILRVKASTLDDLSGRLKRMDLRLRLSEARRRNQTSRDRIEHLAIVRFAGLRQRVDALTTHLTHLSPLNVLERGYAIVQTAAGEVLKDAAATAVDDELKVRLAKGTLAAKVLPATPSGSSGLPS